MSTHSKIGKKYRRDERMIAGQKIHVGQLQWGLQTIKSWSNAIQAAESVYNPRRKPLFDFYNNIEKDPHLDSIMEKRTRAVKTGELTWENIENEALIEQLNAPWVLDLLGQIMSRVFYGYTLINFKAHRNGTIETDIIPRQNVNPELGLVTREVYGETGIPYLTGRYPKLIMPVGKPSQLGKLSRVGPYALMKKDNLIFYAYHNQFFGMPLRVYTYEPGNMTQRRELEQSAEAYQAAPYIIVPKNGGVEIKDSNKAGASAVYKDFHGIMNDEMSISILGQTLTTSNDGIGSHALGRVHEAVEEAVNLEDMLTTEYILNFQVLDILRAHGMPIPENAKARFKRSERLSAVQKAQVFAIAAQHTLVKDEVWQKELGIDPPSEAELKKWREDKQRPVNADPDPKIDDEDEDEDPKKKSSNQLGIAAQLETRLEAYYGFSLSAADSSPLFGSAYEKNLTSAIKKVHSGRIKKGDIDAELVRKTAEKLFKGVQEGFGAMLDNLEFGTPDYAMLAALKNNVYTFSAWKNHGFINAASDLLLDDAGKIRSFQAFYQLVRPQLADTYYDRWLISEYNTAVGKAQAARQWLDIERRDEPVMLRWRTVKDLRVRDSHERLDGITLPSDHDFWKTHWYPLDYNCRCVVSAEPGAEQADLPEDAELPVIPDGFKRNPGMYREIFSPDHPYFGTVELDTLKAFDEVRESAVKEVRDKAITWTSSNLVGKTLEYPGVGTIEITRAGIKHLMNQSKNKNGLEAILATADIERLILSAEQTDFENDKLGRDGVKGVHKLFNTYKIGAKGYEATIIIRELDDGSKYLYDLLLVEN